MDEQIEEEKKQDQHAPAGLIPKNPGEPREGEPLEKVITEA